MPGIKVAHVITGLDTGGAETMLYRLLGATGSAGLTPEVISLTDIGPIGKKIERLGVPVGALGMRRLPSPAAFARLVAWISRSRPDVVQTWMYHADLLGGLAAYLAGRRNVVWNLRTAEALRQKGPTKATMRLCAATSRWLPRRIVCVAEAARQAHVEFGYDPARMVVIPNGLDTSAFDAPQAATAALRAAFGLTADDTVIGCVGRFHPDKGQETLVHAAARVVAVHPRVKFVLVGPGCEAGNEVLSTWIDAEGLRGRFVLMGEREDVPVCLSTMDLFCLPSNTEGFPNALAEAMAMGLPSVATNVGDAALVAGDTAILVPPSDERALARGLLEALSWSPVERRRIGEKARQRVEAEFSIERAASRFATLYEDVMREAER